MHAKHEKKKTVRPWMIVLAIAVILAAAICAYMIWERPPELPAPTPEPVPETTPTPSPEATPEPTPEPMPDGTAFETSRQDGVYTMLLVGLDQMSGSTDTILVGRFDTVKHKLNLVSIPRDTLINVDAEVRKLNSVYAGSINWGGNGIDALMTQIDWLTGFVPDCYAVLNLETFIRIIDEIGGVDFDVPTEMEYFYDDISERLYVHLAPGMQHLNGIQAMALCRYRVGYINADYGRIEVQHQFLKACADQMISLGTIPHARAIVQILGENLKTNLSTGNIAWFMRQLLQCRSRDINFYTMPSEDRVLMGYSYVLPRLWEWIDMINVTLNPFEQELGMGNMNFVYCSGTGYEGTQGYLEGDWYFQDGDD